MALTSDFWKNDEKQSRLISGIKSRNEAIVFTINMFKGGVGKSTLSNLFGYIANRYDLQVLFIDTDPQRTLTKKLNKNFDVQNEAELSFMEGIEKGTISKSISSLNDNIDLVKGDWNLAWFDRYSRRSLNIKDEFYLYQSLIEEFKKDYDFIIFDSVPTTTTLTHNCIVASDYVLVPVESEEDCFDNSMDYMNYLSQMKKYNNKLDVLGIIIYLTEENNNTNNQYVKKYRDEYDDIVLNHVITRSRRVMTWGANGISEHKPYDKKTLEKYINVFWEIINRLYDRGAFNE